MGYVMIHWLYSKKHINAKGLTEAELIGTSEYFPFNVCMVMFMEAQGYDIKKKIIFQDNHSTIRMVKNGIDSCTGNSRHINVLHLFGKDIFDKGKIEVNYCPTHLMIAEYFTKPLKMKMFKKNLYLIIGCVHINDLLQPI